VEGADGAITVLDSESVLKGISDIANSLSDLLKVREVVKRRTHVYIVGAKMDIPTAPSVSLIRDKLQRKIDTIRDNRQQSNHIETGRKPLPRGRGRAIQLRPARQPVSFGCCSVGANDTAAVRDLIERIAK
jgi:hypothetical protein